MIKNASEWTTIPTMINALHTLPAAKEGLAITLSVPALLKLLDIASEISEDDKYSLIEAITTINVGAAITLEDLNQILGEEDSTEEPISDENAYEAGWNQAIKANCDDTDIDMSEIKDGTPEEVDSFIQGVEDVEEKEDDSLVQGRMFDDTEPEGQEALEKFQARFNIDDEEPEEVITVSDENQISPELEAQIEEILKIAGC